MLPTLPMLSALLFWEVVLALHIAAVVMAFGVTFAYPLIFTVVARQDARAVAAVHRAEVVVAQRLVMPGLAVVLVAGIYLASKLEVWTTFYVQWGMGATIVLGGLSGMFFVPTARRLAGLAERDVAGAAEGAATLSAEYQALFRRLTRIGALASLLVLVTIYFMATRTGS